MKNLKNYFLPVLGTLLLILDMGFDAVNPILLEMNLPEKWIGIIKTIFGLYGLWKIASNQSIQRIGGGGIRNPKTE